jgi:hypothetical protein
VADFRCAHPGRRVSKLTVRFVDGREFNGTFGLPVMARWERKHGRSFRSYAAAFDSGADVDVLPMMAAFFEACRAQLDGMTFDEFVDLVDDDGLVFNETESAVRPTLPAASENESLPSASVPGPLPAPGSPS